MAHCCICKECFKFHDDLEFEICEDHERLEEIICPSCKQRPHPKEMCLDCQCLICEAGAAEVLSEAGFKIVRHEAGEDSPSEEVTTEQIRADKIHLEEES